jgi:hypothetical protein
LPGPRVVWILAWALVPWLNAAANALLESGARSAVWDQSRTVVILNYAALSLAMLITLWGIERLARRMAEIGLHPADGAATVVLAAATAVAFAGASLVDVGWLAAVLRGGTWFVLAIPFWTFLLAYASLLFGLDRLGREQLSPDAARLDPALGLRPLGDLAFMGLWMLLATLVPVVLTGLPDVVGVVIGLLLLAGGLAAFFLSLFRLHRQMVAVKKNELAVARDLYAQAYEPLRAAPTLDALERQRQLLAAADALEKRALGIHEWPIAEGTVARVITITTSVMAITTARLILDPLGL